MPIIARFICGILIAVLCATIASAGSLLRLSAQHTNLIRNNSMQGVAIGTPGTFPTNWTASLPAGISRQIVGFGVLSDGQEYFDVRAFGANSSGSTGTIEIQPEASDSVAGSDGQNFTFSSWVQVTAEPSPGVAWQLRLLDRVSGANGSQTVTVFTASRLSLLRQSVSRTTAGPGTTAIRFGVLVTVNNGAAIDVTVRIAWPQLEPAASPSQPIRTTGAAVMRSTDLTIMRDMHAGAF